MVKLIKKIAKTAMNEVWEGEYDGIKVAVKKPINNNMINLLRFVKESKYWKEVSDLGIDGVVKVIEINEDEPWCAVEFINGVTLEEEMRNEDAREIAFRMLEFLNILHLIHIEGYLHLDIKPSNIFVDEFGDIKITDWGLAARIFRKLADDVYTFIGTPSYAPPELWDPEMYGKPDIRSDVYEVGTTFYKILTKQVPFTRREEVLNGYVRPFPSSVPKALQEIITKAINPERGDRFVDARHMYRAIQEWLQDERILRRGIYKIRFQHILQITKNHGFSFVAEYPKMKKNTIAVIDEDTIKALRDGLYMDYGLKEHVKTTSKVYHGAKLTYKKEDIGKFDLGFRNVVYVDFLVSDIEVAKMYFEFLNFLKSHGIEVKFKKGKRNVNIIAHKVLIKNEIPDDTIDAVVKVGMRRVHIRYTLKKNLDTDITFDKSKIRNNMKILREIVGCEV